MLCDTYIFYADVYFMQNFIIKLAVLYLSLHINKCYFAIHTKVGIIKIFLMSILGAMIEVIGLWIGNSYTFLLLILYILELPIMFYFILFEREISWKRGRQWKGLILCGFFFTMCINSLLELLWNWFGRKTEFVFLLCLSCIFVCIGIGMYQNYKSMQKGVFEVEIYHGKYHISTSGFYDSGNHMRDPYSGRGVHIVSEKIKDSLGLEEDKLVLIPYQSLGKENGILPVYYVDELIISKDTERNSWRHCPIGVTKENLFNGKEYEIILNEEVF